MFLKQMVQMSRLWASLRMVNQSQSYTRYRYQPQRHYVNDKWKNIIEMLKALQTDYVGIASMSDNEMKMVLSVGSDTNPGDYYMYDRAKNSLAYLGSSRPRIDPKTMSPMNFF